MTGKVAVITGGSRGIGAGIVAGYRGEGWGVVASARAIEPSEDADLVTVAADITERAAAEREAAAQALEEVGASELASLPLGSLSGGELQRVFLAEALVGGPEMLLLDEPLSNLDLRRSRELVETIHGLVQARGVTTLLVAHDINPMIKCLDKVIYIANGKVATGRPDEVLTSERLSQLYEARVEVLHDSRGNLVIVGGEDDRGTEGG